VKDTEKKVENSKYLKGKDIISETRKFFMEKE
jgi:hypothetical protein